MNEKICPRRPILITTDFSGLIPVANPTQQNSLYKKPIQKRLSLPLFLTLAIVTLLSVGGLGIWSVEKQMKENLAAQLKIVLSGNLESLRVWAEGTKLDAQVLVNQPVIHQSLISLLEMAQSEAIGPDVCDIPWSFPGSGKVLEWPAKHMGSSDLSFLTLPLWKWEPCWKNL